MENLGSFLPTPSPTASWNALGCRQNGNAAAVSHGSSGNTFLAAKHALYEHVIWIHCLKL